MIGKYYYSVSLNIFVQKLSWIMLQNGYNVTDSWHNWLPSAIASSKSSTQHLIFPGITCSGIISPGFLSSDPNYLPWNIFFPLNFSPQNIIPLILSSHISTSWQIYLPGSTRTPHIDIPLLRLFPGRTDGQKWATMADLTLVSTEIARSQLRVNWVQVKSA